MNKKGIIYLIQPAELVGTERYKIGCSTKNDLERCKKGYKKGSRYIIIMECDEPFIVEQEIKKEFNIKFRLIAGREYYEGNEKEIKKKFYEIINKYESSKTNVLLNPPYIDEKKINKNNCKKDLNIYKEFMEEIFINDEKVLLSQVMVWNTFKYWYEISYNDKKQPSMKKLKEFLIENGYSIKKSNIYGIKFKELQDEIYDLDN